MMVLLVGLEMLSQISNSLCEQGYLNLGRACVVLVGPIVLNDFLLFLQLYDHYVILLPQFRASESQTECDHHKVMQRL